MKTENIQVHVLLNCSTKTGKLKKTLTALGPAQLMGYALYNIKPTETHLIFNRETGKCVYLARGKKSSFPEVVSGKKEDLGYCEDYGIPLEFLQSIIDDRFDN